MGLGSWRAVGRHSSQALRRFTEKCDRGKEGRMDSEVARDLVADGLKTVREAASFLGISVAGTYQLMARGDLPFVKIGRSRRIPRRALVELAAKNLVGRGDA
jgi:excisionase family DNA binding protein